MAGSPRRRLEWSARAGADLAAIDAWYAQFGETTAGRVVSRILGVAGLLQDHPFLGPQGIKPGTRHRIVDEYPYTIVFRVTPSKVRVIRVLHQRRAYFQRMR